MGSRWYELSCGACGGAEVRLRAQGRGSISITDIAAVCCGCGSVTHLQPTAPTIELKWGRTADGEKNDGVLCAMDWKVRP